MTNTQTLYILQLLLYEYCTYLYVQEAVYSQPGPIAYV